MAEPIKTKHKDLLNALDGMVQSPTYALRRGVLQLAEITILAQEERIQQLEEQLNAQKLQAAKLSCTDSMDNYVI